MSNTTARNVKESNSLNYQGGNYFRLVGQDLRGAMFVLPLKTASQGTPKGVKCENG